MADTEAATAVAGAVAVPANAAAGIMETQNGAASSSSGLPALPSRMPHKPAAAAASPHRTARAAEPAAAVPNNNFGPQSAMRSQTLNMHPDALSQTQTQLQQSRTKAYEPHRPRVLVAKQVPEDHFGRDGVYVAPGANTIPLTLVRLNANAGPRRSHGGGFLEHTILGDVDDFTEFENIYNKEKHNERGNVRSADGETQDNVTINAPMAKDNQTRITFQLQQDSDADEEAKKMDKERLEWLNRLHIFQRYREVREEHALANWKRHSIEWSRVEDVIAKRINKPVDELLMARLNEYRRFIEERDLIEEALLLLEEHKVNFWKTGLRIGNDLLGLSFQMPRGGPRQIERLRAGEAIMTRPLKKQTEYQLARINELRHVISHLDPFYGHQDSGYLEVVGQGLNSTESADLTREYMKRLDKLALSESTSSRRRNSYENETSYDFGSVFPKSAEETTTAPQPVHGTNLVFTTKRMFFHVLLNQVSSSVLTIHNRGSVSIHFEWESVKRPNPLKVKAIYDGVQRFFMSHTKGVILPNTAYDFPVIFKSASPGLFTEQWRLVTNPAMPHHQDLSVTLQGLAIECDIYFERRAQIEKMLDKRHAEAVARETIEFILKNIKSGKRHPERVIDSNQVVFEAANKELNLRFESEVFDKLLELATATFHLIDIPNKTWDRSVATLYESMTLIPQAEVRTTYIARLNQLVQQASENNTVPRSSVLYSICYDIFAEMATKISEASDGMRKRLGLPTTRAAAKFFETDDSIEEGLDIQTEAPKQLNAVVDATKKPSAPSAVPNAGNPPDPKKPAPAPTTPTAAKDVKKGASAAVATKPAEPTKKSVIAVKRPSEPTQDPEESSHAVSVPKTTTKKRSNSGKNWPVGRRVAETKYLTEFRSTVHDIVEQSIVRLCGLFEDVSGPTPRRF